MATYTCGDCSMSVKDLTCGTCGSELIYAEVGENSVGVSQCPMIMEKLNPQCAVDQI